MHVIRVRAWNTKSKEMFLPETMAEDQLTLLPTGQFINVHSAYTRLSIIYPLDTMIPMLSTGLKDKNGTEVFEGDIVELDNNEMNKYFVNWISSPIIEVKIELNTYQPSWQYFSKYGEVIGNIYSNSELLEADHA